MTTPRDLLIEALTQEMLVPEGDPVIGEAADNMLSNPQFAAAFGASEALAPFVSKWLPLARQLAAAQHDATSVRRYSAQACAVDWLALTKDLMELEP